MDYDTITSTLADLNALGLYTGVGDVYIAMMTKEDTRAEKPTYSTPVIACEAVSVGQTPTYAEGSQSASDRTIRKIKVLKGMDVKVEYPRMKADVRSMILGRKLDDNGGELVGDSMAPLCAVGTCATRDDGTRVMRWIFKCRASEGEITDNTAEEGSINYTIPTISLAGVPLSYETPGVNGEAVHLVQYVADTAHAGCKWTEETFFAAVVGPWSEVIV
ncbi:MAG: hypothetical protein Q4F18_10975 [Clostridia bacterium]|nr:hypothetical protein [Clostridia bacterium]